MFGKHTLLLQPQKKGVASAWSISTVMLSIMLITWRANFHGPTTSITEAEHQPITAKEQRRSQRPCWTRPASQVRCHPDGGHEHYEKAQRCKSWLCIIMYAHMTHVIPKTYSEVSRFSSDGRTQKPAGWCTSPLLQAWSKAPHHEVHAGAIAHSLVRKDQSNLTGLLTNQIHETS